MASSQLLLIAAGSGSLAWLGPEFDVLALLVILILAKFGGRTQSMIGAALFTLFAVAFSQGGIQLSQAGRKPLQLIIAVASVWICAFFASERRRDAGHRSVRKSPIDVSLDKLSKYVWSRTADGNLEYVSEACCEFVGMSQAEMNDHARVIHPDDVGVRDAAMEQARATGEPQEFQARYRAASGEYQWFATLLHNQRDSRNQVIRYFGLQWNIDQQKRKEQEMRHRDNIWETASKILPGWIWVARPDGASEYTSARALEYTGLTETEGITNLRATVHPDDYQAFSDHWTKLLKEETSGEVEIRIRRADGDYRWFLSRAHPIKDPAGKVERWVTINWDIDERKRAEKQSRDAEELFRKIADGVPACICIMAPDGQMVYANKVVSTSLGKPAERILGSQWMQHIHPEQHEEAYKSWMRCVATRTPLDTRWRMLDADGRYRWRHILAAPSFDDQGHLVNWYLMAIEIDEQVRAQQALETSEREARELLNRIPAMIAVRNRVGVEFVSDRFLQYVGKPADEVLGYRWLEVAHPDDRERIVSTMGASLKTNGPSEMLWRMRDKHGDYRWFHTYAEPFIEEDGTVQRWYSATTDIEDMFRSREIIRDHRMQLNLLAESFPGFLWKALPDGQVTYLNRYSEDYLGLPPDEVRRKGWLHLVHPEDQPEVMRRWDILVSGGQWHEHVHRLKGKDGQYRWFQSMIATIKDDSGAVTALHGLMMDAQRMVTAEKSVRQEERQLRRLVDTMPAMIWRADPTGQIDSWNRRMIQIIGKPWESPDNFELLSKIDPEQAAAVEERWKRSVRLGIPYEDTYRMLGNDGHYQWHLVRAEPFRDEDGRIICWYGVHTNIEALKRAENVLQVREHQLLGIIETVPSLLWSASPSGEPTHISRRARDYSGMSLETFLSLGWQAFIHPDDFENTTRAFFKSVQTGESFSVVHRLRRADGQYRWHHAMGEPLRDPDGQIVQWYGLSVDIDVQKRAEDHLREMRAKLNKASRIATVAELSASIAHELNQPLMSVISNAQASKRWLAADPPNLEEATASIERILRDGRAADETMQHIRALFRRETFDKKEAYVPEMISEAVRMIHEIPGRREVPIEYSFDNDLPRVSVDPLQIQEVFINLISNAVEAMEGVTSNPYLHIRASVLDAEEILIQVIDNGPGVDNCEAIFDAFVTTKEKGMGIGLAVSRSIVEAHEGQLWAENNPGGGARFSLRLPLSNAFASAAGA